MKKKYILQFLCMTLFLSFFAFTTNQCLAQNKTQTPPKIEQTKNSTTDTNKTTKTPVVTKKEKKRFGEELFRYPIVVLFTVLALGLWFGKQSIKGLSLGSSGVLFAGLLFGHLGYTIPAGVGSVGLVLFVFCLGITAGPNFFSAFAAKGKDLAKLALLAVLSGTGIAYILIKLTGIPAPLGVGICAGSLTSTPGLASALDGLPDQADLVSIGYGLAYPFGVIGIVVFIQIIPKLAGISLAKEEEKLSTDDTEKKVLKVLTKVENNVIVGKTLADMTPFLDKLECRISRKVTDNKLQPIKKDYIFQEGDIILILGTSDNIKDAVEHIGSESSQDLFINSDDERQQIVVTSKEFSDKRLSEIAPLDNYNVVVSRVTKNDLELLAKEDMLIEYGDLLTVVGLPEDLKKFATAAGNKTKALHATDIASLAVGIALGVLLGKMPIKLPGLKPFMLGMAGGPLFVALVMGYFRRIGSLTSRIPIAAKTMLMDIGLLFFLANAGIKAGGRIAEIVAKYGINLFLIGAAVRITPIIVTFFVAQKILKMNIFETLGGMCGGMTSTPALGAISSQTDSKIPITSYATAYPVALILMTIAIQIMVSCLK